MNIKRTILIALATLVPYSGLQAEIPFEHHVKLTPENSAIGNFPAQKAPILKIKSGETVKFDTGGGARWATDLTPDEWLQKNNIPTTMENPALQETFKVLKETQRFGTITNGHLLVGPVEIEGAEPGDTLEVKILSVVPRIPYGTVSTTPGRGGIPDKVPRPYTKVVVLDLKRNVGLFEPGVEVPLGPFMGVMGTQPPEDEGPNRRSGPPGKFGGNLDCKELVAGATLYLPIFHAGARFFTGDAHAAQGDGEVTVNAIETANTCVLKFILHKGKTLKAPRAETPTHYMAFGLDPDLDNAMQMAILETNDFLADLKGWDFFKAFTFSSIAIDFRVTQVVDGTKGIHSMIPKKLFSGEFSNWLQPPASGK